MVRIENKDIATMAYIIHYLIYNYDIIDIL